MMTVTAHHGHLGTLQSQNLLHSQSGKQKRPETALSGLEAAEISHDEDLSWCKHMKYIWSRSFSPEKTMLGPLSPAGTEYVPVSCNDSYQSV